MPGLRGKVMVEAERLERIRQHVSASVPSDMLEAQEILTQKESILNQSLLEARRVKETAMREAEAIKSSAMEEHAAKVGDAEIIRVTQEKAENINQEAVQDANHIVQEAQRNAFRIVGEAEKIAASRREGADQYARGEPLQPGGAAGQPARTGPQGDRRPRHKGLRPSPQWRQRWLPK